MSVIVRGMEMPERCAMCFLRAGNCKQRIYMEQRPKACPLIEIHTPHGRLIDADKLMMSLADWWYSSFGQEETYEAKAIRAVMQQVEKSIDEMMVIEAEGSE